MLGTNRSGYAIMNKQISSGVYRLISIKSKEQTLGYFDGKLWFFFGGAEEGCEDISEDFSVDVLIDWMVERSSYRITSNHPRAGNMVLSVEDRNGNQLLNKLSTVEAINVMCRQLVLLNNEETRKALKEIGVIPNMVGDTVLYSPEKFRCVDNETGEVYAEWGYE